LKDYIIKNLANINSSEYSKIFVNFFDKPLNGFISDISRNPIGSLNLLNINNVIYQNYDNTTEKDIFEVNISYGLYYANKTNMIVNINIIKENKIIYKNNYINDFSIPKNNILNVKYPTYVIDLSISYNPIKIEDYYKYLIRKTASYNNILKLNIITTNNNPLNSGILFNSPHFYDIFGPLSFNLYHNIFINTNELLITDKSLYDYQYLRYDFNNGFFKRPVTLSFNIMPYVLFPYPMINNYYDFNLSFYENDVLLKQINYTNKKPIIYNIPFNLVTTIENYYDDSNIQNTNNIRFEYYVSSNIISYNTLNNYITEYYFSDFIIKYDIYDETSYSIGLGKNINIAGLNNLAIGSNINIIGNNSIVFGNNNSKYPIKDSIIIGKDNIKDNHINKGIIIGNSNKTSITNSNQIIIGNNLDNKYLTNIDNVLCRDSNSILIGTDETPILFGYNSNDTVQITSNTSLYIKKGINLSNLTFTNNKNQSITLKIPSDINSNIIYTLPIIPQDFARIILSTDSYGNLKWTETSTFDLNTNLSISNLITSNVYATGFIFGDGSKLTNVNISDRTTDDLIEGSNNLYYTDKRASNIFFNYIDIINTDYLKEGSNNYYYTSNRDSNAFYSNLSNISTDYIKEGISNLYFNSNFLSNAVKRLFSNYTTDDLVEGTSNFYITQLKVDDLIKKKTTDNFIEGSNNRFFTYPLASNLFTQYFNNITTDNLKEGSNNLYFYNSRLQSNVNFILNTKTTDNVKQGIYNLYYNQSNILYLYEQLLKQKSTSDFKETSSNLFFNLNRFDAYLLTKTTDNVREGNSNLYLTNTRVLNILSTLNSDFIKEGSVNLYYKDLYAEQFLRKSFNLLTTDLIKEGSNNKYIINNSYNTNLNVKGSIYASNVYVNTSNILDLYNESLNNARSNYAKDYIKYTTASNLSLFNNSNQHLTFNINMTSNNPLSLANGGSPFIIVGSNVGINILNPSYNLHVNGYTFSTYLIGDGSGIYNLNINDLYIYTDIVKDGTSNQFIKNNTFNSNLTIYGDIMYNNAIIKGDIIPFNDKLYNIGTSNIYFNNIYSSKIFLNDSYLYSNNNFITINDLSNNKLGIDIRDIKLNSNVLINYSNNLINILDSNNNNLSNIINYEYLSNTPIINCNIYSYIPKNLLITSNLFITPNNITYYTPLNCNLNILLNTSNNLGFNIIRNSNNDVFLNNCDYGNLSLSTNNIDRLIISSNGNINIKSILSLNGKNIDNYITDYLNTDLINTGFSNRFIVNDIYNRDITFTNKLINSNLLIYYNNSNNLAEFYNGTYPNLFITSYSNIGIGLTSPKYLLDVNGSINANDILISNISINTLISNSSNSNFKYAFNNINTINTLIANNYNNNNKYTSNTSNTNYLFSLFLSNNLFTNILNNNSNQYSNTSNTSNILFRQNSNLNFITSNFLLLNTSNTSNVIFIQTSNLINSTSNNLILNTSNNSNILYNFNLTTSNRLNSNITDTSNIITITTYNLINLTSNRLTSNTSNTSNSITIQTSNLINLTSNNLILNTSNTSNILYNSNLTTSNRLISYTSNISNILYNTDSNNFIINSNQIRNTSNLNYLSNNSLNIKINNINTDTIPIGTSNRFITNDRYDRPIVFQNQVIAYNLITSNMQILGNVSNVVTVNTQTDKLTVINNATGTAGTFKQLGINYNVLEVYNNNNLTFVVNSNGNVGINTINPLYNLDINGSLNTKSLYVNNVNLYDFIILNSNINNENSLNYSNNLYQYTYNGSNYLFNYIDNGLFNSSNTSYNNSNNLFVNLYNLTSANYGENISNTSNKLFDISSNNSNNLFVNLFELTSANYGENISNTSNILIKNISNVTIENSNNLFNYSSNTSELNKINVNSNILYTSNILYNNSTSNFNNLSTINSFGYNSTIIDFCSIMTSNEFIINSSNYTKTHTCSYKKYMIDSELLINTDFPYIINGYGTDTYVSRLKITSEIENEIDYSLEHTQLFIGYAAGGGTRSTTLSPIIHKTNIRGSNINICVEIKLVDSDDYIQTDNCIFIITEKKPSSKLILTDYITPNDVIGITSNLYLNSNQLSNILKTYQKNDIGVWNCNLITDSISYIKGNVGIGMTMPKYNLEVNSNINCGELYRNGIPLQTTLLNYITSNDLANNIKTQINSNIVGYNTTLVDVEVIETSNVFIISSNDYTNTHTTSYKKFFDDSEIVIQVDFPYLINGFGTDSYASRLEVTSDIINIPEYSIEHKQIFIGYAAGGGTRSTTLSPINHKTILKGNYINISVQLKLIDSDDSIYTDKCIFIITEKKNKKYLQFSNYVSEGDIPKLTSNLYINQQQLTSQINSYGRWKLIDNGINYDNGFVGIGINNPEEILHVNGNIIASGNILTNYSDIRLKTQIKPLINTLDIIDKISCFKYKPNELAINYGFEDKTQIGLNAQEIKNLIPEIVSIAPFDIKKDFNGEIKSKSGNDYLTIQYEKLIPYLIQSIKELKELILNKT